MINNKKFLALIPARSGSKGLKDKNIKLLHGKPLLAYTIESAIDSQVFDDIVVSTDSALYADIAKNFGATVPCLRPQHLSSDTASSADVIDYTLKKMASSGRQYDYFMLLQPTSPLRDKSDIINAVSVLLEKNANAVISVCEADHAPQLINVLDDSLSMDNFIQHGTCNRRQDLPQYYRLNGAIYLANVDYFLEYRDFYKDKSYAYIMDKRKSIDIDDIVDFIIAEALLKQ